jgi:5-methylcytosine-specific restriction protein A
MPAYVCLCGAVTPRRMCTRCTHQRQQDKAARRPRSWTERQRRAEAVAQWVAAYGYVCPGWQAPPHPSHDLTADHIDPVARGGDESGDLTVLCRPCNSRKRDQLNATHT